MGRLWRRGGQFGQCPPSFATGRNTVGAIWGIIVSVASTALVVENQVLCRAGLVALLAEIFPNRNVASVDSRIGAVAWLQRHPHAEMVTIDLTVAESSSFKWVEELTLQFPSVKLVIVDWYRDRKTVFDGLSAGAVGFISKDLDRHDMIRAFKAILADQVYVPPFTGKHSPVEVVNAPLSTDRDYDGLTDRQREVLAHLATGKSNKEIARALRISECTVKVHVAATFRQLGVRNRVSAVAALQSQSLNQIPQPGIRSWQT